MTNSFKPELFKLIKTVSKKIVQHGLINKNDRIMVGISGGKDSLLLLEILGELKSLLRIPFEIIPVHIHLQEIGYCIDTNFAEDLCEQYNTTLITVSAPFSPDPTGKKGPCFLCSWQRRKILFELTKKLNCNKLALGHHMDDAIQTLLMNMIYHGSISSMPIKLSMFNNELELIRPLLFIEEKDIIRYKEIRNYPQLIKNCPYGDDTKRNTMAHLINQMELIHPHARKNIFRSMAKIYPAYLPEGENAVMDGLNVIHPKE